MVRRSLRPSTPCRAARPAAIPAARSRAADEPASLERYLVRVDRATGREQPGPIHAEELLVGAHRDSHPASLAAQFVASRLVGVTGSEWVARQALRAADAVGNAAAGALGALLRDPALERVARRLFGVDGRDATFRFRDLVALDERERNERIGRLRRAAAEALSARGPERRFHVLLTGATGFLGREVLVQAARDPHVEEVVCLCRPRRQKDRRTGRIRVTGVRRRGALLLGELGLRGRAARKFRFVRGDVERPDLGLRPLERARLLGQVTHLVHCAASVAFDAPYEDSFRANVLGSRHALAFSLAAQRAPGSPFVAHVAIETSFVHGRTGRRPAREGMMAFPPHYYNNYYELTKAMATLENERAMLVGGLRVVQLLPSIIVGDAHSGNNRGDTKVVNAPVNAFGRVRDSLRTLPPGWASHLRGRLVGLVGMTFPADPSAEFNLVTVDRVAAAVLAALDTPSAIGVPIHIATDRRIRVAEMTRILREELGVQVWMADPTFTRRVALPLARGLLSALGNPPVLRSMEKLGGIFGFYSEWGQTVHAVGEDVRTLRLPARRPDGRLSFRMLCRHNRYVQEFGRIRDAREIARREAVWEAAIDGIEYDTGRPAARLSPPEFRQLLEERIDLPRFRPRPEPAPGAGA